MPDPLSSKPLADLSDPLATQSSLDSNTNPPRSGDVEADEIDLQAFLAPPQGDGELGRLERYRILKELGRGGMGMVLLAEDSQLRRLVAIKIMLPRNAKDSQARERFLREARSAARIHHDNVVTIHQVDESNGIPFIAMEFLKGTPLNQYLQKKGELSIAQAVSIGHEIAEGLQAAHAEGLIHRDIKPANIWLEAPKGRVKILDFGLAREERDETHLTHSGAVVGTPSHMSPEQARGKPLDLRSDLFSLGVVLYRLCTGQQPFTGPNTMAVLTSLAVDTPTPPRQLNPNVPVDLEQLIHRLLAKDRDQRPPSAEEVAKALAALDNPTNTGVPEQVSAATAFADNAFPDVDATTAEIPVKKSTPSVGEETVTKREQKKKGRRSRRWVVRAVGAVVLIAGGFYLFNEMNSPPSLLAPRSRKSKPRKHVGNGQHIWRFPSGSNSTCPEASNSILC